MFDLNFVGEIRFFLFPENTEMYKLLTANYFKINQDRKTALFMGKCFQMGHVKTKYLKLKSYLDEYCAYFNLNRNINLYDF